MQRMWDKRDLPGKVIGITPNTESDEMLLSVDLDLMDIPAIKGSEIKEWLSTNGNQDTHYAILDDLPDMLPEQESHFVQTDPRIGITKDDSDRIITILTGNTPKATPASIGNLQGNETFANKKIVVLGDIHGNTVWKDIIAKEQPDQVIFLGDYVSTHENVSDEEQVETSRKSSDTKMSTPRRSYYVATTTCNIWAITGQNAVAISHALLWRCLTSKMSSWPRPNGFM